MLKKLFPYEYVESVFTIDYKKLYKKGYRGLIFDIDNTLVSHGADSTPEIDRLFKQIQNLGFKTFLLSDNGVKRIEKFLKNINNTQYIDNANKPNTENFLKTVQIMGIDKQKVVNIGDQIFKDILGANRANIPSILVKYIGYYKKQKIGIKRHLERIILKIYQKNKKAQNRLGGIELEV